MSTSLLIFAAIAVLAFVLYRMTQAPVAPPQSVKELIGKGAIVVDVRTPGEFRSGAYPGAKNIPLQELPQRLGELPKNRGIIVYCASGSRSSFAAQTLAKAGFPQVLNGGGLHHMKRA